MQSQATHMEWSTQVLWMLQELEKKYISKILRWCDNLDEMDGDDQDDKNDGGGKKPASDKGKK